MKPRKKRPIWRYLLEALVIIALIFAINSWRTRDAVSGPAPELSGTMLNGESYQLPAKPGEPLLVYFWASWCPVCKLQDGNIATLSEEFPVITVAMSSGTDEEIREYLEQEGLELAVINDDTGEISNRWGVKGVPTTFVIDGDGEVRFVEVGYTTTPGLWVRRWLAEVF
ncbi:MAG: protein disulfide oxidoreductase [Sedimenticolaceae bacterium]|nr:protein disulfide oxidoreductase [Sedimenticolaceae bacterium]